MQHSATRRSAASALLVRRAVARRHYAPAVTPTTSPWSHTPPLTETSQSISLEEIQEMATESPTPMTLQQMRSFATGGDEMRLIAAEFLHNELQIRFARAIVELSELPIGLSGTSSIRSAMQVYAQAISTIKSSAPPTSINEDRAFTEALRNAKDHGTNLVPLICGGLKELGKTDMGHQALQLPSVQQDISHRLDTFFLSRIGIRMLIGQHVESMDRVGGRVERVDVERTVRGACERAANLCRTYCGVAPEFEIHSAANASAPFTYVESHLHHMVFELVKNAMRATVEFHNERQHKEPGRINKREPVMNPNSPSLGFVLPNIDEIGGVTIYPDSRKYRRPGELPPVQIVLCQGQEDLTIKVMDEGGGVPRSNWHKLWHYGYTTSAAYPPLDAAGGAAHSFRQHFSGGGYGLPIARLFARYFGGEVSFISLEGSGSSAFIQAHRLGRKMEMVPGHASFSLQPLTS